MGGTDGAGGGVAVWPCVGVGADAGADAGDLANGAWGEPTSLDLVVREEADGWRLDAEEDCPDDDGDFVSGGMAMWSGG